MKERDGSLSGAVADRIIAESKPGRRDDGFKIGLVIEGGCMGGVVSAGMVLALGESILSAFDAIYGVSAGSAAAAYLLSNQSEAISVYYEDVNNVNFFDPGRFFSGKPVVDISYLTHKVMKEIKPLQWEKVVGHPIELHILVTEANRAEVVDFNHFDGQDDLLDAIYYSCLMPIIAGPPALIDENTALTDGAVSTGGICLAEALADGCTHVLVLRTGAEDQTEKGVFTLVELIGYLLLKREYPLLAQTILFSFKRRLKETLQTLQAAKNNQPNVEAIALPKGCQPVAPFEMDKRRLIRGARDGYKAATAKLRDILSR